MLASVALLLAQAWDGHHDFDGGWIVMMISMVLFWALVIVGIVLLVRYLSAHDGWGRPAAGGPERPLEVLQRRFAEGEISTDEYRERRAVLRGEQSEGG